MDTLEGMINSLFHPQQNQMCGRHPIWSDTVEERFCQAANWLDTCGRHGIALNPEKFCFAQGEFEFAGFEITNDTVRACKRYMRAIANFPTP